MTFADEIEDAANGELIVAVVIGSARSWGDDETDDRAERRKTPVRYGKTLTWAEARPMLDYEYDGGYGGADCDAIWAWTASHILFVSEYDGSTQVVSVPRSPVEEKPRMI